MRWDHAWYPLRSIRIRGQHFRASFKVPHALRGRVLKLRVIVPNVGASHTVRVRTR
jgi:hypothetical protein